MSTVKTPILVDLSYAIENWIPGKMRNIFLHLCDIVGDDVPNLRKLIGICLEFTLCRSHFLFRNSRINHMKQTFRNNDRGGFSITKTSDGVKYTLNLDPTHVRAFFLDGKITQGIFNWVVRIKYTPDENLGSEFSLGVASLSHVHSFLGAGCDVGFALGSSGLCFHKDGNVLFSRLEGVKDFTDFYSKKAPVPDDSLVAVEVNSDSRTMCFFVNGVKAPHAVSQVRFPLYLGISCCGKTSFTSISVHRQLAPTRSSVPCYFYDMKI